MEGIHLVLAVILTAALTAGGMWYFGRERQLRRTIARLPIVKVRDVTPGLEVRVTGALVLGSATLEAPFSHRVCAHYDALLEERYLEDGEEAWHTVAHEAASRPFFIEDETGRIEIDTARFEGVIVRDHHKAKGDLDVEKARAFLAKHGQKSEIPADRVLRYREGVLEAGETVTVLGTAREESREGKRRLVLGEGTGPVRASDDPDLVR
ncbi:MAG: GIDE domain-containing protein [Sandaracinus sp.]